MKKIVYLLILFCITTVVKAQEQYVTDKTSKALKKISQLATQNQDTQSIRYEHAWNVIRSVESVYKNVSITKTQDAELAEILCEAIKSKEDKHFVISLLRAQAIANEFWEQESK